jgi:signal transduction histidine kinase
MKIAAREASGQAGSVVLVQEAAIAPDRPRADGTDARSLLEMCHDLLAPAAAIKLLVKSVGQAPELDPAVRDQLQLVDAEAGRIAEICNYLLDRVPRKEPVRLDSLVGEVAVGARLRFGAVIEVATEPVSVRVHPAVAFRILINLLDNACRAAGPGGFVRLIAKPLDGRALLTVSDSGHGLGHGPSGRASLGLDIVGALVLESGGTLELRGSELGGLGVSVILPGAAPLGPEQTQMM